MLELGLGIGLGLGLGFRVRVRVRSVASEIHSNLAYHDPSIVALGLDINDHVDSLS